MLLFPILNTVIYSRWILLQLQRKDCCKKEKGSYQFVFSLKIVTFYYKIYYIILCVVFGVF